jgi:hypothetical protein
MMKSETLRALLVDHQLGELPADVTELLDAYIAAVPAARSEADATARTVNTARETIRRYPNLVPTAEPEAEVIPIFLWLARIAAVIAVAAIAGWVGYRTGHAGKTAPTVVENHIKGVWAQYQVAYDSSRGRFVVAQQD